MQLKDILIKLLKEGEKGKQYSVSVQIDEKRYSVVDCEIVNPIKTIVLIAE